MPLLAVRLLQRSVDFLGWFFVTPVELQSTCCGIDRLKFRNVIGDGRAEFAKLAGADHDAALQGSDGLVVSFQRAVEAFACMLEVFRTMAEAVVEFLSQCADLLR